MLVFLRGGGRFPGEGSWEEVLVGGLGWGGRGGFGGWVGVEWVLTDRRRNRADHRRIKNPDARSRTQKNDGAGGCGCCGWGGVQNWRSTSPRWSSLIKYCWLVWGLVPVCWGSLLGGKFCEGLLSCRCVRDGECSLRGLDVTVSGVCVGCGREVVGEVGEWGGL